MYGDMKILTGTANPKLAQDICEHLGCHLTNVLTSEFSDGELRVEIIDSVRGQDVFVVQPTCSPSNKNLMQLCLVLDALKRASAGRITAVVPYFGYARQDRKVSPRAPISAKLVSDFISVAGAQRVVTVDLHAGQIQGFSTALSITCTPLLFCSTNYPISKGNWSLFLLMRAVWKEPEVLQKK